MLVHLHPLEKQNPFHSVKKPLFPCPDFPSDKKIQIPLLLQAFESWVLGPAPWDGLNVS